MSGILKLNTEKYIYLMIILNPFFEIIYSLLSRNGIEIPINQMCRIIMFLTFWLITIKRDCKTFMRVLDLSIIFSLIWFIQIIFKISTISFEEIIFLIKLIYVTSLPFLFESFIKTNIVKKRQLENIIIFSTFVIIASICISPLGLGFQGWTNNEYRTGYVGWFRFGNYLTATLLTSICLLIKNKSNRHRKSWLFFTILSLFLIGNKAGLVGVAVFFVCHFIFIFVSNRKKYINRYFFVFMLIISPIIVLITFNYFFKYISNQIAMYHAFGYKNILTYMLSNRNIQIETIKKFLSPNDWNFLIGYGYTNIIACLQRYNRGDAIEMDLYALYYYVGIIPLLIWIKIYSKALIQGIKSYFKDKNEENFIIIVGVIIIICHSIFTGHVVFESLTIVYVSALLAISNVGE